jgi:hypothetical protein
VTEVRLTCSQCGQLAYWGYERPLDVLELTKQAHEKRNKNHIVTWEIK